MHAIVFMDEAERSLSVGGAHRGISFVLSFRLSMSATVNQLFGAQFDWSGAFTLIGEVDSSAGNHSEEGFFQWAVIPVPVIMFPPTKVFERDLIPIDGSIINSMHDSGRLIRRINLPHSPNKRASTALNLK